MPVLESNKNGTVLRIVVALCLSLLPLGSLSANGQASSDNRQTITANYSAPEPYTATFRASIDKGIAIDGEATRVLERREDGLWNYRFKVDSFVADIEESLVFRWQDNHVEPLRYRYKLSGVFIRDRTRAMDFDWNKKIVQGDHEGKTFRLPLREGTLDPLGYQLQLHQDIRAGITDVTYTVIDKGRYDEDHFAVIGMDTLDTRLGAVDAIKVEKVRGEGSHRETLMWFAPQWDHLLVRLTQREPDGTEYEIHIEDTNLN